MCATFDQAFALYAEVEMIPRTSTRQLIQLFRDLSIDGVFVKSARAVLLLALDRGKPAILKMVHTKQCAEHEGDVWSRLNLDEASAKEHHLVGPLEFLEIDKALLVSEQFRHGDHKSIRWDVLMPKYVCPMTICLNCNPEHVLKWCRHIKIALDHMHSVELCHIDLKLDNIFLDYNGDAFLGDYRGSTLIGHEIREESVGYFPSDLGTIATPLIDHLLLIVTALQMCGKWNPIDGPMTSSTILEKLTELDASFVLFFGTFGFCKSDNL